MGGRGSSFGLNDSSRSDGGVREPSDYEDVKKSNNPFRAFKTYQNEFNKVKTVDALRKLLDQNGVSINENLYKALKSGKIDFDTAKEFMKGSLLVVSHQGNGKDFTGFGSVKSAGNAVAFYSQENGSIHIVQNRMRPDFGSKIGGRKSQTARSVGAHEAMHHSQNLLERKKLDYSNRIVRSALRDLKRIEPKQRGVSNSAYARSKISGISSYAWRGGNGETVSEAMNDVMRNGARATNLSKIIYKRVKNDIKKYKF